MEIKELISRSEVDDMLNRLDSIYNDATASPDTVIVCPLLNPMPYPTRKEFYDIAERSDAHIYMVEKNLRIVQVTIEDKGKITAAWGPANPNDIYDAVMELADFLPNGWNFGIKEDGWVTRLYFQNYIAQKGPFNVNVHQPGLPMGTTYGDFDDVRWNLDITPDGSGSYKWMVSFP